MAGSQKLQIPSRVFALFHIGLITSEHIFGGLLTEISSTLVKTESDRQRLLLRDGFAALLANSVNFPEKADIQ